VNPTAALIIKQSAEERVMVTGVPSPASCWSPSLNYFILTRQGTPDQNSMLFFGGKRHVYPYKDAHRQTYKHAVLHTKNLPFLKQQKTGCNTFFGYIQRGGKIKRFMG